MTTSFWDDTWYGKYTLRIVFPRLYLLSKQKSFMVGEIYNSSILDWDLTFRRRLRVWEADQVEDLKWRLSSVSLQPRVGDSLRWKWDSKSNTEYFFSVKSCYEIEMGIGV